jgi:hypothetical protein
LPAFLANRVQPDDWVGDAADDRKTQAQIHDNARLPPPRRVPSPYQPTTVDGRDLLGAGPSRRAAPTRTSLGRSCAAAMSRLLPRSSSVIARFSPALPARQRNSAVVPARLGAFAACCYKAQRRQSTTTTTWASSGPPLARKPSAAPLRSFALLAPLRDKQFRAKAPRAQRQCTAVLVSFGLEGDGGAVTLWDLQDSGHDQPENP